MPVTNPRDIPEVFKVVIQKSHNENISVPDVNGMYYAAGWSVSADKTIIEHSGGNPNFSTQVTMLPSERTALCLLTNGANTNIDLVKSMKDILDGNLTQSYKISSTQLLDIILSSATIIVILLAIMFFLLGSCRKKMNKQQAISKKGKFSTIVWLTVTLAMCIMYWAFPMFIGYDWPTLLVWQTYSILTGLISLALLTASITCFIYTR